MAYPHDPPFPAAEFDRTDRDKFSAIYYWAGSGDKAARWLQANGLHISAETINGWRRKHDIPVANKAYRDRGGQFERAAIEAEISADSVMALLEYLRSRTVPEPRAVVESISRTEYATALVTSDYHYPFHHDGAVEIVRQLIARWKPDLFVINGDFQDFAALGRYPKNPDALTPLQRLLDDGRQMLADLAGVNPDMRCIYVPGNHEEDRLLNYLWTHAPALASLRALTLENLLGLAESGYAYAPDGIELTDEFVVIHGDRHSNMLGGGSGASARKEGLDLGVSSVTGHTHHGGVTYRQDRRSYRVNAEGFCLCDQEKMRAAGVTGRKRGGKALDWHLGVIRVDYSTKTSRFGVQPIAIAESKGQTFTVVHGEEISA